MYDDFGIKHTVDLYKRLLPALNSKLREIDRISSIRIKSEDIWNYFIRCKWKTVIELELSDMVDDILNTNNDELINNIINIKNNIIEQNIESL